MMTKAKNEGKVPFEKPVVMEYIDNCIRFWRKKRETEDDMAAIYVDAYQSIRMSLFGEFLDGDEEKVERKEDGSR